MKPPNNLPESIRARLANRAREQGEEFGRLLTRYAMERVLYRLGKSSHRDRFILKGAALYALWEQEATALRYRATRDLDFWSSGSSAVESIVAAFREVLNTEILDIPAEADGLRFPTEQIHGQVRREGERYQGCRLVLLAMLGNARIPLHIDFGFGDAITPRAIDANYPTLLPTLAAPHLRTYPRETVVAEKFEALVSLGMANTRLKDFFDLWMLVSHFEFEGPTLRAALQATFVRRNTPLPVTIPIALTSASTHSPDKIAAWRSFGKRSLVEDLPALEAVGVQLNDFLMPVALTIGDSTNYDFIWRPHTGWMIKS